VDLPVDLQADLLGIPQVLEVVLLPEEVRVAQLQVEGQSLQAGLEDEHQEDH
jgi:hypothetical protein